jgi:acyl carrier protein
MDTTSTIMNILTEVFRQVFDNPNIVLTPETTADEVEGWDSLSHVNLIMAIEMRFNISFMRKEALSFKNVGALADCIQTKLDIPG